MSNELKKLIETAHQKEVKGDHLPNKEKVFLINRIRTEDNIDPDVSDKKIYDDYIIQ